MSYVIWRSSSALIVYDAGLVCRSVYHFFVFSFAEKFAGSCVTWPPPQPTMVRPGLQQLFLLVYHVCIISFACCLLAAAPPLAAAPSMLFCQARSQQPCLS